MGSYIPVLWRKQSQARLTSLNFKEGGSDNLHLHYYQCSKYYSCFGCCRCRFHSCLLLLQGNNSKETQNSKSWGIVIVKQKIIESNWDDTCWISQRIRTTGTAASYHFFDAPKLVLLRRFYLTGKGQFSCNLYEESVPSKGELKRIIYISRARNIPHYYSSYRKD